MERRNDSGGSGLEFIVVMGVVALFLAAIGPSLSALAQGAASRSLDSESRAIALEAQALRDQGLDMTYAPAGAGDGRAVSSALYRELEQVSRVTPVGSRVLLNPVSHKTTVLDAGELAGASAPPAVLITDDPSCAPTEFRTPRTALRGAVVVYFDSEWDSGAGPTIEVYYVDERGMPSAVVDRVQP